MSTNNVIAQQIEQGLFTRDIYNKIVNRYELSDIDLDEEYTKIIRKESKLSRRKRDVVLELAEINVMLTEFENKQAAMETTNASTEVENTENISENIEKTE